MRAIGLALVMLLLLPVSVSLAQEMLPAEPVPVAHISKIQGHAGEVIDTPICFDVINKAPYTVHGSFATDYFTASDGTQMHHRSNFRLETAEKSEFCTFGPFFEGGKLELTLRTLIPLFSCQTGVTGNIIIYGRRKPEGGTETWATCL